MKRLTVLMILATFLIGGAFFHSCKKDEVQDVKTFENPMVKVTDSYDLPIFMDQNVEIGYATISFNYDPADPIVSVDITLNPPYDVDWEITEAHFYFDAEPPKKSAPGQFPYHWYPGDPDYPEPGFDVAGPTGIDLCLGFDYYYAIHIALQTCTLEEAGDCVEWDYETAWVLPAEGGFNWIKGNGAQTGWGEYFQWHIDYVPDVDQIELYTSVNEDLTDPVMVTNTGGFNYEMCLDPAVEYYYFDAVLIMGNPLLIQDGTMNGFVLDYVDDPGFWAYWLGRGVDGINNAQGWELYMWDIINGFEPMFYVKRDGSDYQVIDGLQYLLFQAGFPGYDGTEPLRLNGDYYPGSYSWTGTLQGDYCTSDPLVIGLSLNQCD